MGRPADRLQPQFREVAFPERQPVQHRHGARQADLELAARPRRQCFQQLFAVGEQVVDHRLSPRRGRLAELVGALVAPEALLPLDDEFLHVAQVAARLANEIARRQFQLVQIVAAEAALALRRHMPLPRDQRHADRPHHPVVRRHRDLLPQKAGERRRNRVVVRRPALEVNYFADLAPAHHPVQVVQGDGVGEAGHQVRHRLALVHPPGDVALHKHRAALTEPRGTLRAQCQTREFPLDADAQLLRLLFQERARARRAGLIHGEIHHHAVFDGDELRILPADLENRVHRLPTQRFADVDSPRLVRRDFVVHHVRAHELGDQFAPASGGPHAAYLQPAAPDPLDFGQSLLHRLDGPPRRAQIHIVDHRAELVNRHHVGRYRPDIQPQVRRNRLIVGWRHVDPDPVAQLHHVLRGERPGVLNALFHIVLPQAVYIQNGAFALLLSLQDRRADGPAPGILRGHE